MPTIPACWKASIVYGDNNYGLGSPGVIRDKTFPDNETGEADAKNWASNKIDKNYEFTVNGIQYTFLPNMISHIRIEFVEEVVTP